MNDFASANAVGDTPAEIAHALADRLRGHDGHTVGFLYVTSPLAGRFAAVVSTLRQRTGIEVWIGTAGHGICASGIEHWGRSAAVAMTCRLPRDSYRLVSRIATTSELETAATGGYPAALGIVHGDPRNADVIDIVGQFSQARGAYLVGGLTSADGVFPQVAGEAATDGGVSGILLGGKLNVAVGLTQGCTPIGPAHEVTRCEGQIVAGLDRQRAYDLMCEDVGIAGGADARPWLANVHAALLVAGSTEADYMVRNLVGIDPRQGLVAVAENMRVGDRMMFVRRDAESAGKDLARMLDGVKSRLTGPAKAGLYYSCVARGPNLFDAEHHEIRAIRDTFGDIPLAGFFGNGEICHDRVYAYTGVLTIFS
jgi:small ligand-binding sensory domain FIST